MTQSYVSQLDYSFYSEPLPDNKVSSSEQVAFDVIQLLLYKTYIRIDKRLKFKQNLKAFSQLKTIKNINQINSVNSLQYIINQHYFSSYGKQPQALLLDSLLPISASIDKTNQYKNRLKNQSKVVQEVETVNKKQQKNGEEQIYIKLNEMNTDQQDGYTKQLRKIRQDNKAKLQKQLKDKQMKQKLQMQENQLKSKQKKKQVQVKISYDYSGDVIKQKIENRANLISKLINGKQNGKTLVNKEAFNDKNPTTVESTLKTRKKNQGSLLKKRQDLVYFSQNFSISQQFQVYNGVKFTAQGATLQKKTKPLNAFQLKKSLSTRKLSKQQFQKVKQFNGSSYKPISKTSPSNDNQRLETKHKRSKSQMNFSKRPSLPQSIIFINNQKLKDKMLQTIVDNFNYHEPQQKKPEIIHVSQSDLFNIKYIKTKNASTQNEQQEHQQIKPFILPKISKIKANFPTLPKERQRIKQNKNIIYEIRKQLDQKLKY